jgi:hypothetical protein
MMKGLGHRLGLAIDADPDRPEGPAAEARNSQPRTLPRSCYLQYHKEWMITPVALIS